MSFGNVTPRAAGRCYVALVPSAIRHPFRHQFYMEGTFASVAALRAAAHCDAYAMLRTPRRRRKSRGRMGGEEEEEEGEDGSKMPALCFQMLVGVIALRAECLSCSLHSVLSASSVLHF